MAGLGGLHSGLNGLLVARQSEAWGARKPGPGRGCLADDRR